MLTSGHSRSPTSTFTFDVVDLRIPKVAMAKGKQLGCLAHAPAREALFVLHSGFAPASWLLFLCGVSPVTGALIGYHKKRDTAISTLLLILTLSTLLLILILSTLLLILTLSTLLLILIWWCLVCFAHKILRRPGPGHGGVSPVVPHRKQNIVLSAGLRAPSKNPGKVAEKRFARKGEGTCHQPKLGG